MRFKNSKQRKAVMARLKNSNYSQIRKQGIYITKQGDADKDGIKNYKDCKPFDPNRQGKLHELQVKLLKRKEANLEKARLKEQTKLNKLRQDLAKKRGVINKKNAVKKLQLKQKQAVINEINREQKEAQKLREANQKIKQELDKHSTTGKAKRVLGEVGKGTIKTSRAILKGTGKLLNSIEWG